MLFRSRTYQDVITDRRDAVALYQDSKDAPQWMRGIMAPYAAEEKAVEPTLQPLPLDEANEYNALKERYPDALVGYEQHGNFEFYGEDAKHSLLLEEFFLLWSNLMLF